MYLSRVKLNLKKRKTSKALTTPTLFHGAVERSFGDERKRNLWRVDRLNDQYYLLVVSHEKPDLSGVVEQFGSEEFPAETKVYDDFWENLKEGDTCHFRIVANPTKRESKKSEEQTLGKIKALSSVESQMNWLIQKGEKNGFAVNRIDMFHPEWLHFNKKNHQLALLSVTYEGVLTIKDVALFKEALCNGIGREKAYGMGMLTIAS